MDGWGEKFIGIIQYFLHDTPVYTILSHITDGEHELSYDIASTVGQSIYWWAAINPSFLKVRISSPIARLSFLSTTIPEIKSPEKVTSLSLRNKNFVRPNLGLKNLCHPKIQKERRKGKKRRL